MTANIITGNQVVAAVTSDQRRPGDIVKLAGLARSAQLGAELELPAVVSASLRIGGSAAARGMVGVILGRPDGGQLELGDVALVLVSGIVPDEVANVAPGVGDPVYLAVDDDTDEAGPDLTPDQTGRVIGTVVAVTPTGYRWAIDGRDNLGATGYRSVLPSAMRSPNLTWNEVGFTGDDPWGMATSELGAGVLVCPLPVNPGEVLDGVEVSLHQGSASAGVVARLWRGDAAGSTGSDPLTSPAMAGPLGWAPEFRGELAQPVALDWLGAVSSRPRAWLTFTPIGGDGVRRMVCGVVARVRPLV